MNKKEEIIQKYILASIHSMILLELLEEIPVKQSFKKSTKRYIRDIESNFQKFYDSIYQNDEELVQNLTKKHERVAKWISEADTEKIINLLAEVDKMEYKGDNKLLMEKVV